MKTTELVTTETQVTTTTPATQNEGVKASVANMNDMNDIVASLQQSFPVPISMIPETWTPETTDVNKPINMIFMGGAFEEFTDPDTGEVKNSPKVYFGKLVVKENKEPYVQMVRVGCIDLVAAFHTINKESLILTPKQPIGSAWQITYTGTRPSKTNTRNKINTFVVLPLVKKA
jgi:hypothetical protein